MTEYFKEGKITLHVQITSHNYQLHTNEITAHAELS